MSELSTLLESPPEQVALIDHRTVAWQDACMSRYWMRQCFQYVYPGPIRELRQRLMVVPASDYGSQHVTAFDLRVSTPGASTSAATDGFGNRVFYVYAPEASTEVTFETRLVIERNLCNQGQIRVAPEQAALFLAPTALTASSRAIEEITQQLLAQYSKPHDFAEATNSWVYGAMRYASGVTSVSTSAAAALALGQGLCQDYAHIMLAICRAAHIPARYVSGHMLGEGGSHAWVEVLLPQPGSSDFVAVAFDPTNHRRATPIYITVAVGRDYRDVAPTSGSFVAPYSGHLTASKRAGLTHVAFQSGSCLGCAS